MIIKRVYIISLVQKIIGQIIDQIIGQTIGQIIDQIIAQIIDQIIAHCSNLQSQTLSRLAAAHRGAVRALQTFIGHAPLQSKINHGLPPTYQELALLIRQLSVLSAQLQIGGDDVSDHLLFEVSNVDCWAVGEC